MMRLPRTAGILVCLALVLAPATASVASQSIVASLSYPTLAIELTDTGMTVPASIPAGRTAVTVYNAGSRSHQAVLVQLPVTATPTADGATPAALTPNLLQQSSFPGFPGMAEPGATGFAVVDLSPGSYAVIMGIVVRMLTVTDAAPGATPLPDPPASATISLFEFDFQLPATIASGDQLWKIVNAGRQPHELAIVAVPAGTTRDDLIDAASHRPIPGTPSGGLATLSPGAIAWTELDLQPGTYAAICTVTDPDTGETHAMEGMIEVFEVK